MSNKTRIGWGCPIPYGTSEKTSVVLDRASNNDFSQWDFTACKAINDWPTSARMSCVELQGERRPDDVVPNHLGLIVVSEKCREVIQEIEGAEKCVEFLRVQLDYLGQDVGKFYVVNILASIAAMDRNLSRFDVYTSLDETPRRVGDIKTVRRLVLLPGLLKPEVPVFRLKESPMWVLFSPLLRAAIESADVRGFEWIEVSVSSDGAD